MPGNARKTSRKPRPAARRRPGRPAAADRGVGRDALIHAACELLEVLPPVKVTRAAVARQANVDPALIRYYFRDRESLLLAVVQQLITGARGRMGAPVPGTAVQRLRHQIRGFFEFNVRHPYYHRLLVEETANSRSPAARRLFHQLNQRAIEGYAAILKQGSRDKTLRRVEPALLHIAIVGMCEFYLASRALLRDAFGKAAEPTRFAKLYADLITDLVVEGLRAR